MPSQKNVTGYDKWSEFYDTYPNPVVAIDELFFPKFYSEIEKQRVLEIGCGTGRHTARLIKAKNEVIGIDISEGMLEKAKQKVQSSHVTFVKGDFLQEKVPEIPFDSIVMSLVLEHIAPLDEFFKKARYFLKPGGKIYFSEIHPERAQAGMTAHFKLEDANEFHLESIAHTKEEIEKASSRNGFSIRTVETIHGVEKLCQIEPKWGKYLDEPMIQIWVFTLNPYS